MQEETETTTETKTEDAKQATVPELVALYNAKCEELEANHTGLKPLKLKRVKNFKSVPQALRALQKLETPDEAPSPDPEQSMAKKSRKAAAKPAAKPKKAAKKAVKKAAAKPAAKPKKAAKKANGHAKMGVGSNALSSEFGFTAGGDREKLLLSLSQPRLGRQVPKKDLKSSHMMGALNLRIRRKKLPYKIVKEKTDDGFTYGLYRK